MDYYQIIAERFQETMENIAMSVDQLAGPITQASEQMTQTLLGDRKIFACGNGIDGALAQLFTTSMLGGLDQERPALPVFNLCADAASASAMIQSNTPEEVFAHQLRALGQEGDLLLLISSGGNVSSLQAAFQAAGERNMHSVLLSNESGLQLQSQAGELATTITAGAQRRSHVVELHTMILQMLCQLIEFNLFGPRD